MNNLAHPYAKAAFETAESSNMLDLWLESLKSLSLVIQDADFIKLINNPKVSNEQTLGVLFSFVKHADAHFKNFLVLLCDNHRLPVLPEICVLFEQLCNAAKNKADAVVQSAFAMSPDDKYRLEELLSKKLGKKISANVEVCPELIGGIKVIINDTVIDSSVRGSLNKMATKLIQ